MFRFLGYTILLIFLVVVITNTHTSFYKCCESGKKYTGLVRDYVLEPVAESGDSINLVTALCKVKQAQHALRLLSEQVGGTRVLSGLVGQDVETYSVWIQEKYDNYMSILASQQAARTAES